MLSGQLLPQERERPAEVVKAAPLSGVWPAASEVIWSVVASNSAAAALAWAEP